MVSCDVLSEAHDVEQNNRHRALKNRLNSADISLLSKRMLEIAEGVESIEHNEIVGSDHWGHSMELNLELNFDEDFNKENERK